MHVRIKDGYFTKILPFALLIVLICIYNITAPHVYSGAGLYEKGYRALLELDLIILLSVSYAARKKLHNKYGSARAFTAVYASVFLIYGEIIISILLFIRHLCSLGC